MAIVGMFAVHPAGPGRQPGLQGPNTGRNPTATLSPPHVPRRPDGCFETHHGALLLTGRPDHDAGHRARRPTGGPQPCRAHPRDLWAVTPGPLRLRRHVTPLDLEPAWQREARRTFSLQRCRSPGASSPRGPCASHRDTHDRPRPAAGAAPRRRRAATRSFRRLSTPRRLSRHGPPAPLKSGRRSAPSPGTTNVPSPMTTTRRTPAIPESPRFACPRHQVPTRPHGRPSFLHPASSPTHGRCQRRRVASCWLAAPRHSCTSTSTPTRP
jgi:hypothetical protein